MDDQHPKVAFGKLEFYWLTLEPRTLQIGGTLENT